MKKRDIRGSLLKKRGAMINPRIRVAHYVWKTQVDSILVSRASPIVVRAGVCERHRL